MTALRLTLFASGVLAFALTNWRIGHLARLEQQDRQLIAGLEDNYATNADFRRMMR